VSDTAPGVPAPKKSIRALSPPNPSAVTATRMALVIASLAVGLSGCAARVPVAAPSGTLTKVLETREGLASYYGQEFEGRITASGVPFDMNAMVAAHPRYPFRHARSRDKSDQRSVDQCPNYRSRSGATTASRRRRHRSLSQGRGSPWVPPARSCARSPESAGLGQPLETAKRNFPELGSTPDRSGEDGSMAESGKTGTPKKERNLHSGRLRG
jgi:hypothetical protein